MVHHALTTTRASKSQTETSKQFNRSMFWFRTHTKLAGPRSSSTVSRSRKTVGHTASPRQRAACCRLRSSRSIAELPSAEGEGAASPEYLCAAEAIMRGASDAQTTCTAVESPACTARVAICRASSAAACLESRQKPGLNTPPPQMRGLTGQRCQVGTEP